MLSIIGCLIWILLTKNGKNWLDCLIHGLLKPKEIVTAVSVFLVDLIGEAAVAILL